MLMLFGGGAAALTPPASASDAVYWLNVDNLTHSGDGTAVTAATDQGSGGHTIVPVTTGPTYRATRWGGRPCMEFGTGLTLRAIGGAAPALLNGNAAASTEFTVITMCQPRHNNSLFHWAFDDAASTRGLTCRSNTNAYKPQVYGGTSAGAQATLDAPTDWPHITPRVFTTRRSGGGTPVLRFRYDGVDMADVTWTWTGNHDCDYFSVGAQQSFTGAAHYVTDVIVFSRALSDAEVAEWELYLGQLRIAHPHKTAWGATGDWLVCSNLGQSNEVGYCTGSSDYSESVSNAYFMSLDGFVYPLAARTHDGTNKVPPSLSFPTPVGPSKHLAMAAQMRTNGETRKLLFVPNARISTDSVAWKNNLTTSPPNINTLPGHAKHRTSDALMAPGASLFFTVDQGEANCDNLTEAQAWDNDWILIADELNTYFSGKFDKTTHYVFSRLSVNISGVGANAADVRASQDAFDTARSDAVLYQRPDGTCEGTPGLHLTGTEQQQNGYDAADAWDAAS